jgi:hypothetical protein
MLEKMLSWGGWLNRWFPWLFSEEGIEIGPIPKGTPVSLLTNIDLDSRKLDLVKLLLENEAGIESGRRQERKRSSGSLQGFGAGPVESK